MCTLSMPLTMISIHAPRVGGDLRDYIQYSPRRAISIHAPRVGGDMLPWTTTSRLWRFQSTPPVWGATTLIDKWSLVKSISIHAPRVGGDYRDRGNVNAASISIHAPRVGGDWELFKNFLIARNISIHAPRVGGDTHRGL